jgi:transposase-like protein
MSQHFLLSAASRSLSLRALRDMTEAEVETKFRQIRWAATDGEPVCPYCGCPESYEYRRPSGSPLFRCKACRKDFSITSGTLFAWRKMPLRDYLLAIVIFCNEVKGKSMLALSRDLGTQYKTAFVLAHKLQEAIASEIRQLEIGGEGKQAEVDGAYFGGQVRPSNRRADQKDRRLAVNQSGKRQSVVVIRERNGRTVPGVFPSEAQGTAFIRARVARGTEIFADDASHWDSLHARYVTRRINHSEAYSLGAGVHTNNAESYFSRLRRAEIGHHHHIAGPYLNRHAQAAAWREDHRRVSNGDQAYRIVALVMACRPSVDFCGYWERARAA